MSPNLSTPMLRMSGLKSREAAVAVGRSILIDWSLIIVRLAIMNEASRKNMMSISGIISMRAFLSGNGEPIFMLDESNGIPGSAARLQPEVSLLSWLYAGVSDPRCRAALTMTSTLVAAVSISNCSLEVLLVKKLKGMSEMMAM